MVDIGMAGTAEHPAIAAFYRSVGYRHALTDRDRIIIARAADRIVGAVRLCQEHDVCMLRGMQIESPYQRQGLGTRMLDQFVRSLAGRSCYCVPYSHLDGFYAQAGFRILDAEQAPAFLRQRLRDYRADGKDVILMQRAADRTPSSAH